MSDAANERPEQSIKRAETKVDLKENEVAHAEPVEPPDPKDLAESTYPSVDDRPEKA